MYIPTGTPAFGRGCSVGWDIMPRKRLTPQQVAAKMLPHIQGTKGQVMPAPKRGRPSKKSIKPHDLNDVTIAPVANGWVVTSTGTGKEMFVFEDMEKMFDFIRTSLKPTGEQSAFVNGI